MGSAVKRSLILGLALVLAASTGLWLLFQEPEQRPPDFSRIIADSGLTFGDQPKVLSWSVEESGPFKSNLLVLVEFAINSDDAAVISETCTQKGFAKGVPPKTQLFPASIRPASNNASVCWRRYEEKENGPYAYATYAILDDRLVYLYVSI